MEKDVIQSQANRINKSTEEFVQKISNDWWLYGKNAVEENCADEIVQVECTPELTKQNYSISKNGYTYTYSKCPLVSSHIEKIKNKNDNSNDFLFEFF
jgi:hypothetical protein